MSEATDKAAIAAELKKKGLPTDTGDEDEEVLDEGAEGTEDEGEEDVEEVGSEDFEDGDEEVESESEVEEYTEEEHQAMESGWRPKKEWDGDPEDWVPAKQFIRQGELLKKIHNQNRQLKHLNTVVDTLAKQHKQITAAGYEKAKRELRAAHRAATREEDDAAAEAIETQMERLEAVKKASELELNTTPPPPEIPQEFVSWVRRNDWFVKYPEMRAFAEAEGVKYAAENPTKSNIEVYAYVTERARKRFPERFGMARKQSTGRGSPVEGNSNLGGSRPSRDSGNRVALTAEEKQVGRMLVQRKVYKNLDEYARELKKLGVKG